MQRISSKNNVEINYPSVYEKLKPQFTKAAVISAVSLTAFASYKLFYESPILPVVAVPLANLLIMPFILQSKNYTLFKTAIVSNLILMSGFLAQQLVEFNYALLKSEFFLVDEKRLAIAGALLTLASISFVAPIIISAIFNAYKFIADHKYDDRLKKLHDFFQSLPRTSYSSRLNMGFATYCYMFNILREVNLKFKDLYVGLPVHATFRVNPGAPYDYSTIGLLFGPAFSDIRIEGNNEQQRITQKRKRSTISYFIENVKKEDAPQILNFLLLGFNNRRNRRYGFDKDIYIEFFQTEGMKSQLNLMQKTWIEDFTSLSSKIEKVKRNAGAFNEESFNQLSKSKKSKMQLELDNLLREMNLLYMNFKTFQFLPLDPSLLPEQTSFEALSENFQADFFFIHNYWLDTSFELKKIRKSLSKLSMSIDYSIEAKIRNQPISLENLELIQIKFNKLRKKIQTIHGCSKHQIKLLKDFAERRLRSLIADFSVQDTSIDASVKRTLDRKFVIKKINLLAKSKVLKNEIEQIITQLFSVGTPGKSTLYDAFQRMNSFYANEPISEEEPFSPGIVLAYPPYNFTNVDYEYIRIKLNLNSLNEIDAFLSAVGLDSEEKITQICSVVDSAQSEWREELDKLIGSQITEDHIETIGKGHHLEDHECFRLKKMIASVASETIKKLLFEDIVKAEKRFIICQHALKNRATYDSAISVSSKNNQMGRVQNAFLKLKALNRKVSQFFYRAVITGMIMVPVIVFPGLGALGFACGMPFYLLVRFGVIGKTNRIHTMINTLINTLHSHRIRNLSDENQREITSFNNADGWDRMRKVAYQITTGTLMMLVPIFAATTGFALSRDLILK